MRVLLFCDDFYHPGKVPIEGMEPLGNKGFSIDVISDTTDFDPGILYDYNVVIMSKCDHISKDNNNSWKTPKVQAAFVDFVEKGGGMLAVHSGIVCGTETDTSTIDNLVGCYFKFHPNNCSVTVAPLKPHPITEGVKIFCEVDEHYHINILADDIDIIAASYVSAHGDTTKYESEPYNNYPEYIAPSAYVRTQGKGRVCVITPGHTLDVWHNPEFQKMLENALNWCAGDRFCN